jgi:hypothetical protein
VFLGWLLPFTAPSLVPLLTHAPEGTASRVDTAMATKVPFVPFLSVLLLLISPLSFSMGPSFVKFSFFSPLNLQSTEVLRKFFSPSCDLRIYLASPSLNGWLALASHHLLPEAVPNL